MAIDDKCIRTARLPARGITVAVLAFGVTSCAFAQKHPAVTAGIVVGTIAFGACGVSVEKLGTCSLIGAGGGLGIGGITGLVTLIGETNAEPLPPLEQEQDEPVIRRKTRTAPPPGLPPGMTAPPPEAAPTDPAPASTPPSPPPASAPPASSAVSPPS